MINEIKQQSEQKMNKAFEHYRSTLSKIRTGRAHAGILDSVMVDYYGSMMPLSQVATVTTSDVRTITVQPWEAKMAGAVEKAIRDSDLGLNPSCSGSTIRVPMPALTEERRKELIKVVKAEAEEAKVSMRTVRRDANADFKTKLKDKLITEDEDKRGQNEIQKLTDKYILEIDRVTQEKEKELMTV
jgi:ribosome recycling factor